MAIRSERPTTGMYEAGTVLQCKPAIHKKVIDCNPDRMPQLAKRVQTQTHEPTELMDNLIPPITSDCTRIFAALQTKTTSESDQNSNNKPAQNTWVTSEKLTVKHLEAFASKILPTSVQVQLSQPFGKDTIAQSFYAEKSFCHVLLPLLKSGYLSCRATKNLEKASFRVRQLQQLRKRYSPIDFRQLQGFQSDWEESECIRQDWRDMTTACAMHYNGDIATVVRYIGGPHVNAHIDAAKVLDKLQPILTTDVFDDVKRIMTTGAPAHCNAEASKGNFERYLKYGNHKSANDNPDVFKKTIIKQSKRGLTLMMDPALVHFTLNTHLTPQGLIDIIHHRRKPRPISDSSFRPWPGAHAINDWTSKATEPPLHFADSFQQFLIWQWNLAISYPQHNRHTGDDDVQCAFPRVKYNPNLVAMHSAMSHNTLIMHTGLTFGDNTSPSNWEPIARARQQLAQQLWHDEDILNRAKQFLPEFTFEAPATEEERNRFAIAIPDTKNRGVFDKKGRRISPRYNHHVDDNMYGDISDLMPRAAAASIISLYEIVGYPDGRIPDPISWEKFGSAYGHIRRVVGWDFNTRSLTYTLPNDKRQSIIQLLVEWEQKDKCTIIEAATLHGSLADASRANRQGRTLFFSFQNALRRAIQIRFHQVRGYYNRQGNNKRYKADLPKHLHHRVDAMIARDMAALLWTKKAKITIAQPVKAELAHLHRLLADPTYKWEMNIGHVIPRDPQFTSFGDACLKGGGAFCHELQFWFDMHWSDTTKQAIATNDIHINVMEFIVVIVQLAATITILEEKRLYCQLHQTFPTGIAPLAKLLIRTDNSPSQNWAHKVSAKSERGQQMVHIYAALLDRTTIAVACTHVPGATNTLADFISRPPTNLPSPALRHQQIFEKEPKLASYRYFRPSQELLSNLASRLFNEPWTATTTLPKQLGQFEAGDSITSSFVTL
jgi:hypothetical protein